MSSISSIPTNVIAASRTSMPADRWRHIRRVLTHTHTYSGKADHGGTNQPPDSYRRLARWAEGLGIDAIGMGSPYTPVTACLYGKYDGRQRDEYYAPDFDKTAVRNDAEIARMVREANDASNGRTLFYLDNETPKGRYGHLWWIGYHLDYPAWHDYDQPWNHWMTRLADPDDRTPEPVPYRRRPYREIVAMQRKAGAMGFWAHPTSWWWGDNGRFITNIASEMPAHAVADGFIDGMVIMGYRSWRPEYMDVWLALLDAGYRVTGVAEMDAGLSSEGLWARDSAMTTHVHTNGDEFSMQAITKACAAGRAFASNGPLLDLTVDDQPMGAVVETAADKVHHVEVWLDPQGSSGHVELIGKDSAVLWHEEVDGPIHVTLTLSGRADRGYMLAKYVDQSLDRHCPAAVGNPVYLHPKSQTFNAPATTELALTIDSGSPFRGGRVRFEQADGENIGEANLAAGTLSEMLPASGRFTLIAPDGRQQTEYLINANDAVMALQRYLYRGWFRRDFPQAECGEVPVAAWQLEKFPPAMRQVNLTR